MPARQQVTLEPALAKMLAQHFHDAAVGREVVVDRQRFRQPGPVGHIEDRTEAVRDRFIWPHQAEVARIVGDDVAEKLSQDLGRLVKGGPGLVDLDRVVAEVRKPQLLGQFAAVRVRIRAHPALAGRRQCRQLGLKGAVFVEQFLRTVAAQPPVQDS